MHGQGLFNSYHETCNQDGYEGGESSYWCLFDMANKWHKERKQHNKVYNMMENNVWNYIHYNKFQYGLYNNRWQEY